MKKLFFIPAALIAFLTTNASAAEVKPFAGLSINYSEFDGDDADMDLVEDRLSSFTVNAGVQINRYFSVEAFYQKSTNEDKTNTGYQLIATGNPASVKTKVKFDAFGLDFKGYLPTSVNSLDVFGSIGVGKYKFKESLIISDLVTSDALGDKYDEDNLGFRFGVGAQYRINNHWSLNLTGRYVKIDNGSEDVVEDLGELSLGVKYSF